MSARFDELLKDLNKSKSIQSFILRGNLKDLEGKVIAMDASLLLSKVNFSAKKMLQESHASFDMRVCLSIENIIKQLKDQYNIHLMIVLDGLTPQQLSQHN